MLRQRLASEAAPRRAPRPTGRRNIESTLANAKRDQQRASQPAMVLRYRQAPARVSHTSEGTRSLSKAKAYDAHNTTLNTQAATTRHDDTAYCAA